MKPKISIPYVDNRGGTPPDLLRGHVSGAKALVIAATNTYGPLGRAASAAALPVGDRASRIWLERAHNPYRGEIERIAEAVGLSGVYLLNVCFEWGCTSGVWASGEGALMRRVLDWPFPALGEHIRRGPPEWQGGRFPECHLAGSDGCLSRQRARAVCRRDQPGADARNLVPASSATGSGRASRLAPGTVFRRRICCGRFSRSRPIMPARNCSSAAPKSPFLRSSFSPGLRPRRAASSSGPRTAVRTPADGRGAGLRHQPFRGTAGRITARAGGRDQSTAKAGWPAPTRSMPKPTISPGSPRRSPTPTAGSR